MTKAPEQSNRPVRGFLPLGRWRPLDEPGRTKFRLRAEQYDVEIGYRPVLIKRAQNSLWYLPCPSPHIPRYLLEASLGTTLLLVLLSPLWLWWYKSAAIRVTADLVVP
jgi:hypothetical protein